MKLEIGQATERGRKAVNQDFHGAVIPTEPVLGLKGAVLAIADGISTSTVSQDASAAAVKSFLDDYYCTADSWSVRHAAEQVLRAMNSWLYAQTRNSDYRYEPDQGYVCTFSALVLKGSAAHLLHVGDTRIYRVHERGLEQLTLDHRLRGEDAGTLLSRALGAGPTLDVDYHCLALKPGDLFMLSSDGVHEHLDAPAVLELLAQHAQDLQAAATALVNKALENGSNDNLTVQLVRVQALAEPGPVRLPDALEELPLPPVLAPGDVLDGQRILRVLRSGSRSHVYLAEVQDTGAQVVIKTPSLELAEDPAALERFMLEEWIAKRIDNAHVLKAAQTSGVRTRLYTSTEYVEGSTLAEWLREHPQPGLDRTREIVTQLARGLMAFHRREMLHQDLRPENVLIDVAGNVKIIDFGSTQVMGIAESGLGAMQPGLLGTALYSAPEYFVGDAGSWRSDLYSLGVIAYFMLSGRFPYGNQVARTKSLAAQRMLQYQPLADPHSDIPLWVDHAIRKAVHVNPLQRQDSLSEFLHQLQQPAPDFLRQPQVPLLERNPLAFWQGSTLVLLVVVLVLLYQLLQ